MGVTRAVTKLNAEGKTPFEIRVAVDHKYIDLIQNATPTPYPPRT
jgi:hypothetical protein